QPKVEHDNYKDYGLDIEFIEKAKNRYRLYQKEKYEQRLQELYRERFDWTDMLRRRIRDRQDHGFIDEQIERVEKEINKTINRVKFLSATKADIKQMDISVVKQIPIDSIYEVLPNGFFVNNPLRKERSPSNSFHLNRKTNKWTDYATGEYGDILDLVMKENNLSLKEAYNKLRNIS
ncbi:MAG: hypothetical protein JXA53_11300, partial [Bacteroidales bacterium]|nr:hypothetical protein [Bacteroidales bacterium]